MKKLWVISDTHIPERARKLPEQFIKQVQPPDIILHAGDFTSQEVLEQLKHLGKVYAVWGNMDEGYIKKLLPESEILEIEGKKIGIYHGYGAPEGLEKKVYDKFDHKPDVIVFGHSHTPYNQKINDCLMFNPGSLSGNKGTGNPSYGILHIEQGEIWGEIVEIKD